MTPDDFVRAAFQPQLRPDLLAALQGDTALREAAQREVQKLDQGQQIGQLLDRDHISRTKYDMLKAMLTYIERLPAPLEVSIKEIP